MIKMTKIKLSSIPFLILLLVVSGCESEPQETFDLVISNVNVIDGRGTPLKQNMHIGIKDGVIKLIDTLRINQRENNLDATGKYIIPGLFDAHVHTNNYETDFEKFIHFGITSIFIPGGSKASNSYYRAMRTLAAQDSKPAPRVYHTSQHFTMEGRHPVKTYPNGNWVEGETVYYLRDTLQIAQLVAKVAKDSIAGIKLTIEEGPTPPFVTRMPQAFVNKVASEAKKYNLPVFAHVSDNIELRMALEAGINNIIHFTGVDFDPEQEKSLTDSIIKRNISWVTTLMLDKRSVYPLYPKWVEKVEALGVYPKQLTDQLKEADAINRARSYMQLAGEFYKLKEPDITGIITPQVKIIKAFYSKGVNMVLGTDTGNTFIFPGYSLHEEMQLLESGGMAGTDIIRMGTYNAAKMLQVADSLGTLEEGKLADMILLNKNPLQSISNTLTINMVIKNGKVQRRISN